LGSLKQKIDQYLARQQCVEELVAQAQEFLVGREDKLVNVRKHALEASSPNVDSNNPNVTNGNNVSRRSSFVSDPFSRGTVFFSILYSESSNPFCLPFCYMLRNSGDNFYQIFK
jgi:hypothetical protein